jgi:hypothetical protein
VDEKKLDMNANKSDTKKYVPYVGFYIRGTAVRNRMKPYVAVRSVGSSVLRLYNGQKVVN